MKKRLGLVSALVAGNVFAQVSDVKAEGMKGYNVFLDAQGKQVIQHPTMPGVAFDVNGQKITAPPSGELKKVGTVASDGSVVPVGGEAGGFIVASSWLIFGAILIALIGLIFKAKRSINLKRVEQEAINRMKENISAEANSIFMRFNKNFKPAKVDYISENSTPNFFNSIKDVVMAESDFKEVSFKSVKYDFDTVVMENNQFVASVRYTAVKNELMEQQMKEIKTTELWKLVFDGNKWIVSEIKELAPKIEKVIEISQEKNQSDEKEMEASASSGKYGI